MKNDKNVRSLPYTIPKPIDNERNSKGLLNLDKVLGTMDSRYPNAVLAGFGDNPGSEFGFSQWIRDENNLANSAAKFSSMASNYSVPEVAHALVFITPGWKMLSIVCLLNHLLRRLRHKNIHQDVPTLSQFVRSLASTRGPYLSRSYIFDFTEILWTCYSVINISFDLVNTHATTYQNISDVKHRFCVTLFATAVKDWNFQQVNQMFQSLGDRASIKVYSGTLKLWKEFQDKQAKPQLKPLAPVASRIPALERARLTSATPLKSPTSPALRSPMSPLDAIMNNRRSSTNRTSMEVDEVDSNSLQAMIQSQLRIQLTSILPQQYTNQHLVTPVTPSFPGL